MIIFPGQLSLPHPLQETLRGIILLFCSTFFPAKKNSNPIIIIRSILEATVSIQYLRPIAHDEPCVKWKVYIS